MTTSPFLENNLIYGSLRYGGSIFNGGTGILCTPSFYHNTIDSPTGAGDRDRIVTGPMRKLRCITIKYNIITNFNSRME